MLKVIEINDNMNDKLALTFRGTEDKDFLLAQKIFRAFIANSFCVESEFGYDEQFQEILVFKYPKNKNITLLYDAQLGRYGATWVNNKKQHSIE